MGVTFRKCDDCGRTFDDCGRYGYCSTDNGWDSDEFGPAPEGWDEFVGCDAVFCGNCCNEATLLRWGNRIVGCVVCSKVPAQRRKALGLVALDKELLDHCLGILGKTRDEQEADYVRGEVEDGRMIDDTLCAVCKKPQADPALLLPTSGVCGVCAATPRDKKRKWSRDHLSAAAVSDEV